MKGISVVLFSLATLISVNSFALEITKGHLIDHKEWTTGDAKAVFKISNHIKTMKQNKPANLDSHYVNTHVDSAADLLNSKVGVITNVTGNFDASVTNSTDSSHEYYYRFTLCTYDNHVSHCAHYFDRFELEPGGKAFSGITPEMQHVYSQPGRYEVYAYAMMDGDANNSAYSYLSSVSSSFADIN